MLWTYKAAAGPRKFHDYETQVSKCPDSIHLSQLTHTMDKSHACGCNLLFTLFNLVQIGESEIQRDANMFNLCAPPIISTYACIHNYYLAPAIIIVSFCSAVAHLRTAACRQRNVFSAGEPCAANFLPTRFWAKFISSLRRFYLFSGQSVTNG
jgi:hypothetical protein